MLTFGKGLISFLPNDKWIDCSKFKTFPANYMTNMVKFVFDSVENTVGKGKIASYQHFLHFPQCFQNVTF